VTATPSSHGLCAPCGNQVIKGRSRHETVAEVKHTLARGDLQIAYVSCLRGAQRWRSAGGQQRRAATLLNAPLQRLVGPLFLTDLRPNGSSTPLTLAHRDVPVARKVLDAILALAAYSRKLTSGASDLQRPFSAGTRDNVARSALEK
jgi:hypothetical protein